MSSNTSIRRAEKLRIIKILRALNYFYSLRDLEKILDIPFQSLWKYINFLGIPSDEVVEDIKNKLSEKKIIDELLYDIAKKYRDMPQHIARNIGFIELYSLVIEERLGEEEIDYVFSLSQEAIPLATAISIEMGCELCIPLVNRNIIEENVKILWYYSPMEQSIKYILIPRDCLHQHKKFFLVDLMINEKDRLSKIISILNMNDISIIGIATVYISKECIDLINKNKYSNLLYLHVI